MAQSDNSQERRIRISCDIFNRVFSKSMDYEVFYYKHYENPYKISTTLLNDEINGEIAGVNCFMGAKFTIFDKEIFGAQSCDSAVLPEYRGNGVFSRIIRSAEKQCEKDGIMFLFGFPNDKSYPGFMKLGWVHVGDFYRVVLPLDTSKFLKRKFGKSVPTAIGRMGDVLFQKRLRKYSRKDSKIDIQVSENCPFTETDLGVINKTEGIMIKRSYEYYKWKIDNNPSKKFKYITACKEKRLLGFIIYEKLEDYTLDIVDWFCLKCSNEEQKIVLAKMFYELKGQGTSINIHLVNGASNEVKLLESIGFLNASNPIIKQRPLPLVVKVFSSESNNKLLEAPNWIFRFIDTDVIIS